MKPFPKRTRPALGSLLFPLVAVFALGACSDLADDGPTSPAAVSESPAMADLSPRDFGPAIAAANRHTRSLMANPNIVGTGVGLNDEGEPSVRLFLVHGQVRDLPDHLDGIPVSRVVTGIIRLRDNPTLRARPAPLGYSIGHPDITAGTLGARVTDGENVYILSNNHILANSNDASLGDASLQPGPFDGGSDPADQIGTLYDFEPFDFDNDNEIDAAIAIVDGNDVSGSTPDGVYGAPSTSPVDANVGMDVQKYGRTTGHTRGEVAEIGVTVAVCIEARGPFSCARSATFVDQFTVTDGSFSDGGDSGSLIVTDTEIADPVGLLFAGSSTRTIANPIQKVLDRFGVTIDPGEGGADPGDPGDPDPGDPDPGDPDPGDDDEVTNDPVIDSFNHTTRTNGPWNRAMVQWAVSHPDNALASVTTELLDSGGTVLATQTSSVSGGSASGEHDVRSRTSPASIRLTVTDSEGNTDIETWSY